MIKLPIRQLVEFILRSGDIDSRYVSRDRMAEGAKAHRIQQKKNREAMEDYRSEVLLTEVLRYNGVDYSLEGRADGIFSQDGRVTIDEIKTTLQPFVAIEEDSSPTHWAQAKCYGYLIVRQQNLPEVAVQLTYLHLETQETKQFHRVYTCAVLQAFMDDLLEKYSAWASFSAQWQNRRETSIKDLAFPFPAYRKGQRALAVSTYRTIVNRKRLFVQAPTGTGKTISVLFPAVKAIGEGQVTKIFYLTAKTITRQVAEEALTRMRQGGLKMKSLTLTSKEKICFCDQSNCRPESCNYAKGHFDRVNEAILAAIQEHDDLSRHTIEQLARKHQVCPFEFSLDLALWMDCVICDYNYVFDPRAYLRRFFTEGQGEYVFLIDEAHNLVDRAREMFSAQLSKKAFYQIKKEHKGRSSALDQVLNSINRLMIQWRLECWEQGHLLTPDKPMDFLSLIYQFTGLAQEMLKEDKRLSEDSAFLQLYFETSHFLTIAEFFDERYVTFVETKESEVSVKLFCLDPSDLLSQAFQRGRSAVLFSATLSPLTYFRRLLGGTEGDTLLGLDTPFDQQNLCVLTADQVSTKYQHREESRQHLTQLLGKFVLGKTGNYIVYFPSYQYMNEVYGEFTATFPQVHTTIQGAGLTEEEKEAFLSLFQENPSETYVAFCVLGGIFSEGIDLKGNRLIGAAIVSVGLPRLNIQQNILRDYFNDLNGQGYEYAYMFPGMNKVLQAAGRVIRSETDQGVILLIDERYGQQKYQRLFAKHWHPFQRIWDPKSLEEALEAFWH